MSDGMSDFLYEIQQASKERREVDDTPVSVLNTQVGGGHYKDMTIQPIEYIYHNKISFLEGNVIKYITRHNHKNGADDIRKAIHYCQMILELEYGEVQS